MYIARVSTVTVVVAIISASEGILMSVIDEHVFQMRLFDGGWEGVGAQIILLTFVTLTQGAIAIYYTRVQKPFRVFLMASPILVMLTFYIQFMFY